VRNLSKRVTRGWLVVAGIVVLLLGAALYVVGSLPPFGGPCGESECPRPLILDLEYYGGEILVLLAIVYLIALGVWRLARRRACPG
jgi:hypothetical protein